jgi:hypothetical protein
MVVVDVVVAVAEGDHSGHDHGHDHGHDLPLLCRDCSADVQRREQESVAHFAIIVLPPEQR